MKNDTKRSRLPLAAGLILFAAAALWALTRSFGCGADSIPGATNEQRIAYIESFGWDPGFTHTAVENVRIPVEFDDVYEGIQRAPAQTGLRPAEVPRAHRQALHLRAFR